MHAPFLPGLRDNPLTLQAELWGDLSPYFLFFSKVTLLFSLPWSTASNEHWFHLK